MSLMNNELKESFFFLNYGNFYTCILLNKVKITYFFSNIFTFVFIFALKKSPIYISESKMFQSIFNGNYSKFYFFVFILRS